MNQQQISEQVLNNINYDKVGVVAAYMSLLTHLANYTKTPVIELCSDPTKLNSLMAKAVEDLSPYFERFLLSCVDEEVQMQMLKAIVESNKK